jgi:5-methylcytosine-specific restriction protein A
MPSAPLRPCRKVGCNKLISTTYCDEHQKKKKADELSKRRNYDKVRGTRTERGYDNRWLKASAQFRKGKVCVMCEKKGIVKMAECTDHIIPHKGDMELFWDVKNWQPSCISCNSEKAASEEGALGNEINR